MIRVRANTTLKTAWQLADAQLIDEGQVGSLSSVAARYALAVSPAMAALIDRDDPGDPIARQFVPDTAELDVLPEVVH